MAPFLDPGSMVYDDPARFGYRRLADTLEEHRQLLVQPSWRHIMNYESMSLSKEEMVDTTYEVGLQLNDLKGRLGIIEPAVADRTDERILQAREAMVAVDRIMEGDPARRDKQLAHLKSDLDKLSESTVCEKIELNWPAYVRNTTSSNVIVLWLKENLANLLRLRRPVPQPVSETSEV